MTPTRRPGAPGARAAGASDGAAAAPAGVIHPELTAALSILASADAPAWLVGGAVRDRLLGRPTADYDVVIDGDARHAARAIATKVGAHAFELSEEFGAWRVVPRAREDRAASRDGPAPTWQLDVLPLLHGAIEADLALRDLTINALAQRVGSDDVVDPFGGVPDLAARRLRMVTSEAFERDPLRILRLARLACELDFQVEPETATQARWAAPGLGRVAAERVFEELKRIVCGEDPLRGLRLMDELEITPVVLPELSELRGVQQSRFHHLDVHAHTLAVLSEAVELEREPSGHLGACWEEVQAFMAAPLANGLTRWQALRFGALLHDIAKPETRGVSPEGRVTFMGHDAAGAQSAAQILARWRTSERLREHVAGLVRNHLRLGFLVREVPLSRRTIYRYLRACAPVGVDVTVLSVADRMATRGERSEQAIAAHVQLAGPMLCEALRWAHTPPRPPVRGDDLAAVLGVAPGPALGEILDELQEAAFAHELGSREEAIARARELLGRNPGPARDR